MSRISHRRLAALALVVGAAVVLVGLWTPRLTVHWWVWLGILAAVTGGAFLVADVSDGRN